MNYENGHVSDHDPQTSAHANDLPLRAKFYKVLY
jgi:hypothetical protein